MTIIDWCCMCKNSDETVDHLLSHLLEPYGWMYSVDNSQLGSYMHQWQSFWLVVQVQEVFCRLQSCGSWFLYVFFGAYGKSGIIGRSKTMRTIQRRLDIFLLELYFFRLQHQILMVSIFKFLLSSSLQEVGISICILHYVLGSCLFYQ